MDSGRSQEARTGIYNLDDAEETLDLTLKLGLPNQYRNESHLMQQVNVAPTPPDFANFNISGHYTALIQEASNYYGMMNSGGGELDMVQYGLTNEGGNAGGSSNINGEKNIMNANRIMGWPLPEAEIENSNDSTGIVTGIPAFPNFNPKPHSSFMIGQTAMMDSSSTQGEGEGEGEGDGDESGSSSRGKEVSRRQRHGSCVDPNKRCTNYKCNTNDTPMWRKGPLGPKTLCNACGIKYRKEAEKRKAKEAAKKSNA